MNTSARVLTQPSCGPLDQAIHVLHVTAAPGAGVLRHVLDLATGCLDAGFQLTLALPHRYLTEKDSRRRLEEQKERGAVVRSFGLEPTIRPLAYLKAAARIRRFIAENSVHLVHAHSSRAGALIRLLPVVPRNRCRLLYTPNAFSFLMPGSRLGYFAYLYLERLAARTRTDVLVAVSESERDLALRERIVDESRIRVIPNGVRMGPVIDSSRSAESGRLRVVAVGRLSRQKNPLFFVDVAEALCAVREDVEFRWAGEGELAGAVRGRLAQSPYRDRISFLGHVEKIGFELQSASVFFSSALYEGLPYSGLDGLAHGLPLVMSDVVGNRDMVKEALNGRLYSSGSVKQAVDALLWVLESPDRLTILGRRSAEIAELHYSMDRMIREHLSLYTELYSQLRSPTIRATT